MSLATRLTAFFLVAVALLLGGASVTTYLLARVHIHHDVDEKLMNTLELLAAEAVDRPGIVEWRRGLRRPQDEDDHIDGTPVSWAVFDASGRLREQRWDLGADDLAAILAMVPADGHAHASYEGHDGRRWRLALRRLQALPATPRDREEEDDDDDDTQSFLDRFGPGPPNPMLFLVAGGPLGPVEASLRSIALSLIGLSTGLWLLAVIAGRYYCRRALRPVAAMAASAQAMSVSDRRHHLPSPGTGDELEGLAQSFNGLLDRLHQAIERQARFTGDASHQLRTPLTALIGELEVARRRDRSADDYREVLDEVHAEAVHLQEIVESLLFLARAEAEATCPDLRTIDLAAWLPAHLDAWSSRARGRDIRPDIADTPLPVLAHPALLGQLLDNLLENAAKYSEPGTPIVVSLRRAEGSVELSVADRGIGLGADELPHVFDPFYRSPRARLRGRPGVGLGLAVVQRIAANFGGAVAVEGTPGVGSRFVVRLPEAAPA